MNHSGGSLHRFGAFLPAAGAKIWGRKPQPSLPPWLLLRAGFWPTWLPPPPYPYRTVSGTKGTPLQVERAPAAAAAVAAVATAAAAAASAAAVARWLVQLVLLRRPTPSSRGSPDEPQERMACGPCSTRRHAAARGGPAACGEDSCRKRGGDRGGAVCASQADNTRSRRGGGRVGGGPRRLASDLGGVPRPQEARDAIWPDLG